MAGLALVLSACSVDRISGDGGTTVPAPPADASTSEPVGTGSTSAIVELAMIDPTSSYVRGLCEIDFAAFAETENPMGDVIDQIKALPTDSTDASAEQTLIIERLQRSMQIEDPLATDDLYLVGAILRARCS